MTQKSKETKRLKLNYKFTKRLKFDKQIKNVVVDHVTNVQTCAMIATESDIILVVANFARVVVDANDNEFRSHESFMDATQQDNSVEAFDQGACNP